MGVVRCLRNQKITEKIILRFFFLLIFVYEAALTSEVNMALCSLGVSTLSPGNISRQNVSIEWRPIQSYFSCEVKKSGVGGFSKKLRNF